MYSQIADAVEWKWNGHGSHMNSRELPGYFGEERSRMGMISSDRDPALFLTKKGGPRIRDTTSFPRAELSGKA